MQGSMSEIIIAITVGPSYIPQVHCKANWLFYYMVVTMVADNWGVSGYKQLKLPLETNCIKATREEEALSHYHVYNMRSLRPCTLDMQHLPVSKSASAALTVSSQVSVALYSVITIVCSYWMWLGHAEQSWYLVIYLDSVARHKNGFQCSSVWWIWLQVCGDTTRRADLSDLPACGSHFLPSDMLWKGLLQGLPRWTQATLQLLPKLQENWTELPWCQRWVDSEST